MHMNLYRILFLAVIFFVCIHSTKASEPLRIGWASSDITPEKSVLLRGQFYARMSEGVLDPIGATALSLESSVRGEVGRTVRISCDVGVIRDYMGDRGREVVVAELPELEPTDVTLHANQTEPAPLMGTMDTGIFCGRRLEWLGGEKDAMIPA